VKQRNTTSKEGFDRGLIELKLFLTDFNDSALEHAINFFRTATQLSPENANYWVSLGFALDMKDEPEGALTAMRRANKLDPTDEEVEVFVLTLLAEAGMEDEALSGIKELATRTSIDIESIRLGAIAIEMPSEALTLLKNGFIHPRNFIRSRLEDAMDQIERSKVSWKKLHLAELEDCYDRRTAIEQEINLDQIPSGLHDLVPWVLRLGVGDDPCREMLIKELSQDEKDAALQCIRDHASAVEDWLDSYGSKPLSSGAAAYMYTLLAAEEMNA